jgi:hypothetical protein
MMFVGEWLITQANSSLSVYKYCIWLVELNCISANDWNLLVKFLRRLEAGYTARPPVSHVLVGGGKHVDMRRQDRMMEVVSDSRQADPFPVAFPSTHSVECIFKFTQAG